MEEKISILQPFFRNPGRLLHIREAADLIGISHTSVRNRFQQLVKEGYLAYIPGRPYGAYKAIVSSRRFQNLKLYFNLEQLREFGLLDVLEKHYEYPTIILFGSFAKAMDDEKSDIDICVLSQMKRTLDFLPYEKKIGRPISIHQFDKERWKEAKKKNPDIINSICNGIVLSGQLEVL